MKNKGTILYPMSMLSTIVGNEEKVRRESDRFSFLADDAYFHYIEGELLESINATDVPYLITNGFTLYKD